MTLTFTRIDVSTIDDHYYLDEYDDCYFFGEYTAGAGYEHGDTNQLIFNLKKDPINKRKPEWQHKERAIKRCSRHLSESIGGSNWIQQSTLVPIPPSKAKGDPKYDDRVLRILKGIRSPHAPIDIRELVTEKQSRKAAHEDDGNRMSPAQHTRHYRIDESIAPSRRPAARVDRSGTPFGLEFR